jgi:predicted nucleic acid-binding protein
VVIELEQIDPEVLPSRMTISTVTLAELAAGPHATDDLAERARRQERLQLTEATFGALPFNADFREPR